MYYKIENVIHVHEPSYREWSGLRKRALDVVNGAIDRIVDSFYSHDTHIPFTLETVDMIVDTAQAALRREGLSEEYLVRAKSPDWVDHQTGTLRLVLLMRRIPVHLENTILETETTVYPEYDVEKWGYVLTEKMARKARRALGARGATRVRIGYMVYDGWPHSVWLWVQRWLSGRSKQIVLPESYEAVANLAERRGEK